MEDLIQSDACGDVEGATAHRDSIVRPSLNLWYFRRKKIGSLSDKSDYRARAPYSL